MKLIIDIADNKVSNFMELIKNNAYVKAKTLSAPAAELIEEVNEIKKAFEDLDKVMAGKLKTRPASEILNELQCRNDREV